MFLSGEGGSGETAQVTWTVSLSTESPSKRLLQFIDLGGQGREGRKG